ncbi:MAG: DUF2760 domain-containing protein [Thermoanaerobaculia bacterium]|nr:DUF2760 domain-containing protein [Thermoanaerobaculia bacterium]
MSESTPSFFSRLALAAKTLFNSGFAAKVEAVASGNAPERPILEAPKPVFVESSPDAALQLAALLQQGGRFIDFLEEDVSTFSDAEIGAAARVVHEGCRKVMREQFQLQPVRKESEGTRLTIPEGFDAAEIRLTGNVTGKAPYSGQLVHRGWKAAEVRLPKLAQGHKANILAPAEVEL